MGFLKGVIRCVSRRRSPASPSDSPHDRGREGRGFELPARFWLFLAQPCLAATTSGIGPRATAAQSRSCGRHRSARRPLRGRVRFELRGKRLTIRLSKGGCYSNLWASLGQEPPGAARRRPSCAGLTRRPFPRRANQMTIRLDRDVSQDIRACLVESLAPTRSAGPRGLRRVGGAPYAGHDRPRALRAPQCRAPRISARNFPAPWGFRALWSAAY